MTASLTTGVLVVEGFGAELGKRAPTFTRAPSGAPAAAAARLWRPDTHGRRAMSVHEKTTGTGPLAGVTVLELGGIGPLPLLAMLFADLGARIIRVDPVAPSY